MILDGAQCRSDIIQDVFFSQSRDQVTRAAYVQVGDVVMGGSTHSSLPTRTGKRESTKSHASFVPLAVAYARTGLRTSIREHDGLDNMMGGKQAACQIVFR